MTQAASRGRGRATDVPVPRLRFTLRARLVAAITSGQYDALRASLEQLVDTHGLRIDGTWAPEPSFLVHRGGRAVHHIDRRAIAAWAATRRELVDYTIGPLVAADDPG